MNAAFFGRISSFLQERFENWARNIQIWSMTTPAGYRESIPNAPFRAPKLGGKGNISPGVGREIEHPRGWNPNLAEGPVTPIYQFINIYIGFHSSSVNLPPPPPPEKLTGNLLEAVQSCLASMFGVKLLSFKAADSRNGVDGEAKLQSIEQTTGTYRRPPTNYSVTTSVQYNKAGFEAAFGETVKAPGITFGKRERKSTGNYVDPSVNYRITDINVNAATFPEGFHPLGRFLGATDMMIQIHELGNSLAGLTEISYKDTNRTLSNGKIGDTDSGEAFETCIRGKLKDFRR